MMFMPGGSGPGPPAGLAGRRGAPRRGWGAGRRRGGRGRRREAAPAPRSCRFLRGGRRRRVWPGRRARVPERARARPRPACRVAQPPPPPSGCGPRRETPTATPRLLSGGNRPAPGGVASAGRRARGNSDPCRAAEDPPPGGVAVEGLAGTATPAGRLKPLVRGSSWLTLSEQRPLEVTRD
ncbi:translation initiation factor IF-2-like [Peromyscus leucopus]|uniref:translation initiation factor IF-2-like n=1 Tax=Peromyscus leucopus TaxID=10041 RepID=UPI0018854E4F|nr:translation initiation factor IF-2-like [Peromyscus leucopus]